MRAHRFSSNGVRLPEEARYIGRLRDSGAEDLSNGRARQLLDTQGYVLLRQLLPREHVLAVRDAYFRAAARMPAPADYGVAGHAAHQFVRGGLFRSFIGMDVFRDIAQALMGSAVEQIVRTPLRHFQPRQKAASRAHVDGTYIAGAAQDILTLWVPLGDCPVDAGGLIYLEGSHDGVAAQALRGKTAPTDRPHDARPLSHDLKWVADQTKRRWLMTDYQAGDLIAHSPLIVHASLDSNSDQARLSTDIRFIRAGSPADPRWAAHWSADDGY